MEIKDKLTSLEDLKIHHGIIGNSQNFGHVKITSDINSADSSACASAKMVYDLYNNANDKLINIDALIAIKSMQLKLLEKQIAELNEYYKSVDDNKKYVDIPEFLKNQTNRGIVYVDNVENEDGAYEMTIKGENEIYPILSRDKVPEFKITGISDIGDGYQTIQNGDTVSTIFSKLNNNVSLLSNLVGGYNEEQTIVQKINNLHDTLQNLLIDIRNNYSDYDGMTIESGDSFSTGQIVVFFKYESKNYCTSQQINQ